MKRAQYVIVSGNPILGLAHIGPFPSRMTASRYAIDNKLSGTWWVAALEKPEGVPAFPQILVQVFGGIAEVKGDLDRADVEVFNWDDWHSASDEEKEHLRLPVQWGEIEPSLPLTIEKPVSL